MKSGNGFLVILDEVPGKGGAGLYGRVDLAQGIGGIGDLRGFGLGEGNAVLMGQIGRRGPSDTVVSRIGFHAGVRIILVRPVISAHAVKIVDGNGVDVAGCVNFGIRRKKPN